GAPGRYGESAALTKSETRCPRRFAKRLPCSPWLRVEPRANLLRGELFQGIGGDPAFGARRGIAAALVAGALVRCRENALGARHGRFVQRAVALADAAQRPAHGLLHEVALVEGAPFDERQ